MKYMKIVATGKYLPSKKIENKELASILQVTEQYIEKMTGIQTRYYIQEETIVQMAVNAAKDAIQKGNIASNSIDLVIVSSTTNQYYMPGISFFVQRECKLQNAKCLDISAGCSGFINAFDIARNEIALGKIQRALVVGVDALSNVVDKNDIGTAIVLSDGAGAVILEQTNEEKQYESEIQSEIDSEDILTCKANEKIVMKGKEIYKYAVTKPVEQIQKLLSKMNMNIEEIKYLVPHQSNLRIMQAMTKRLNVSEEKMYINIQKRGNTFCASIPIALDDIMQEGKLKEKDKILLLGYGGGLNTGSILLEI